MMKKIPDSELVWVSEKCDKPNGKYVVVSKNGEVLDLKRIAILRNMDAYKRVCFGSAENACSRVVNSAGLISFSDDFKRSFTDEQIGYKREMKISDRDIGRSDTASDSRIGRLICGGEDF